jgi:opacity protein-like surface antigen
MRSMLSVAASLAVLLAIGAAHAQVSPNEVDQRFQNQDNRINQGVQSGRLTPGQAAQLQNGVARKEGELQRMENRDGNTGTITNAQNARLNRQLNHESGRIYDEKH